MANILERPDAALKPMLPRQDRLARWLIWGVSIFVFIVVATLGRIHVEADLGFDIRIFARLNAIVNSTVSVLLVAGLVTIRQRNFVAHRNVMFAAIGFSALFLVFYIAHHLLAPSTSFGGEGTAKIVYYVLLISHIFLAAAILPFILFTAYRSLTGQYAAHRKLARITYPIWLYVAVSGVVVYLMISPYYA